MTYLSRYTLKAALGLAASADDDAKSAEPADTITQDQVADLQTRIVATGTDIPGFLKYMAKACKCEIGAIEDIPAASYDKAVAALKAKAARAAEPSA
ncbi:hypothetical protein CCR97_07980 [Rhodoplanes elegans]|uniref:Uncharacterized protein n=1 Tax=Rhodoplanes elegans TaxID=29408 RepID=A0A327KR76_9BRAD|nr:hypothetical protein [Rhodoplanes elegans]MBK5958057.1 hypothetical protein [Rhodoplanes elegans]MBK5958149.1 hypothetical protein [Rhodoplanes elegans]RAI40436.1 hypothetical protein CH338_06230 [Rhodoplanes elegans]